VVQESIHCAGLSSFSQHIAELRLADTCKKIKNKNKNKNKKLSSFSQHIAELRLADTCKKI
jgi:hypothetical protein